MNQDEAQAEVAGILHEVADVDPEQVSDDKLLADELGVDSLALFEVSLAVEDKFGVSIPDHQLASLQTVGDLIQLITDDR